MVLSEVNVRLAGPGETDPMGRLKAYMSCVLDLPELGQFCVRDLKVIEGRSGNLFVAMPSRKVAGRCDSCQGKNPLVAVFCMWCGTKQPDWIPGREPGKLYADVFHPINNPSREAFHRRLLDAFHAEVERQKAAG
jgi:stage V sporulation protein G